MTSTSTATTPSTQIEHAFRSSEPDEYVSFGLSGLTHAARKALDMNKRLVEPDHRDGLQFKRLFMTHDLLAERIQRDPDKVIRTLLYRAAKARNLGPVLPNALNPLSEGIIVGTPLAAPIEEINPTDLHSQLRRVTHMGPGGISSDDRITADMQAVDPTIFGYISPIEGPESSRAGLDVRIARGVKFGDNGKLYRKYIENDTGEEHWLAPEDVAGETIQLPDA